MMTLVVVNPPKPFVIHIASSDTACVLMTEVASGGMCSLPK